MKNTRLCNSIQVIIDDELKNIHSTIGYEHNDVRATIQELVIYLEERYGARNDGIQKAKELFGKELI